MPCNLKAAIDLEIDKLLEDGLLLRQCMGCGRYFVPDGTYTGPYCNEPDSSGIPCRVQANEGAAPAPEKKKPDVLAEKCEQVFELVRGRVGNGMDEQEFFEWAEYLSRMRQNVRDAYTTPEELEGFLSYSRQLYGTGAGSTPTTRGAENTPATRSVEPARATRVTGKEK